MGFLLTSYPFHLLLFEFCCFFSILLVSSQSEGKTTITCNRLQLFRPAESFSLDPFFTIKAPGVYLQ